MNDIYGDNSNIDSKRGVEDSFEKAVSKLRLVKCASLRGRKRWLSLERIKKHFLTIKVFRSFLQIMNVAVFYLMALAALSTWICQRFQIYFDVQMTTFVAPTVFPLAFQINATFQRRERVLEYLADLKAAMMELLFCHKSWAKPAGLPKSFPQSTALKLQELIVSIHLYLLHEKEKERLSILRSIYHLFSSISERNEIVRDTQLPGSGPLCTRLIHYHNLMCVAFEKLRIIREYRSPRSIMSFTKVFIFFMPILLSPTYVYIGIKAGSDWVAYYVAMLTSFLFGCLQAVSDTLDDPFDGIGQDDINFKQFENWPEVSLMEFTRIGGQEKRATLIAAEAETRSSLIQQEISFVTDPIERGDGVRVWNSDKRGNLLSCSDAIGLDDLDTNIGMDDSVIDFNLDSDADNFENQTMMHDGMYAWTSATSFNDNKNDYDDEDQTVDRASTPTSTQDYEISKARNTRLGRIVNTTAGKNDPRQRASSLNQVMGVKPSRTNISIHNNQLHSKSPTSQQVIAIKRSKANVNIQNNQLNSDSSTAQPTPSSIDLNLSELSNAKTTMQRLSPHQSEQLTRCMSMTTGTTDRNLSVYRSISSSPVREKSTSNFTTTESTPKASLQVKSMSTSNSRSEFKESIPLSTSTSRSQSKESISDV